MINKTLEIAEKQHRKAIEMTYDSTCTIKEYKSAKDPITKITKKQEVIVLENQPCSISYKNAVSTNQTKSSAIVQQVIKLFIAPEIEIKEGSKIFVEHDGRNQEFKHSGKPAIYNSHQEIILELVGNA